MLPYDPIPWLMEQEGLPAVRARRAFGLERDGDAAVVRSVARRFARSQHPNGSFEDSHMKTAAVTCLLGDLRGGRSGELIEAAATYLLSALEAQPGHEAAKRVKPGTLTQPFDLCGFFGPQGDRLKPDTLARNAREVNLSRKLEPLHGPKSPVKGVRKGSFDRPGPSTCYTWGMVPLCHTIEAACRAGHADDPRLKPAINALLGAQRENGGWCGCPPDGAPPCTTSALRALSAHPKLKRSKCAERGLALMHASQWWVTRRTKQPRIGSGFFATIEVIAAYDHATARDIIRNALTAIAPRQRRNGTFGTPCQVERVAAVICGLRALEPGTS